MSQFYLGPAGGGATGNVMGTPPSTDNAIARYDGITGLIIQNSSITIDDNGNLDSTATYTGNNKYFLLQNNDNTAGSSTRISQFVGGTSAGDLYDEFVIGSSRSYSVGVDNDDSQTFKITTDGSGAVDPSSGTSIMEITSGGGISFPSAGFTENGVLYAGSGGSIEGLGEAQDGELLIGFSGLPPVLSTLSAGTGISIVNSSGSVTISSQLPIIDWYEIVSTSDTLIPNSGYIANNASLVTLTLPNGGNIGDTITIVGKGAGLFRIAQPAGKTIYIVSDSTTTGVTGSITAIEQYASVELVCTNTDDDWTAKTVTGNFTVV